MSHRRTAALLAIVVSSTAALAQPAEGGASKPAPEVVTVGAYVLRIHELSLKENFFTADVYVWFRWRNPELHPYRSFALPDARIDSQTDPVVKTLPTGEQYAYVRVVARVTKFWDITEYPLDKHALPLAIEEDQVEDHLIRYVADGENSGMDPGIVLPGWTQGKTTSEAGVGRYQSNFGDVSLPSGAESRYGRFVLTLRITREGTLYFMKLFFGLWVSAAIAFLAFFIRPQDVDPRFGLGVGAIFAAIASGYIVTEALPDTNIITLADKLHIVAFAFIFASIGQSTWSLWLATIGEEAKSRRADRVSRVVFPLVYVVTNALVIVLR